MCWCSILLPSALVEIILGRWRRVLITTKLCCNGWCEWNSKYCSVCVFKIDFDIQPVSHSWRRGEISPDVFPCELDVVVNRVDVTCKIYGQIFMNFCVNTRLSSKIFALSLLIMCRVSMGLELQLTLSERKGSPQASHQSFTGSRKDKQPFKLTFQLTNHIPFY